MNSTGILSAAIQKHVRFKNREILKSGLAGRNAGNILKGRVIHQRANLNVIRFKAYGAAGCRVELECRRKIAVVTPQHRFPAAFRPFPLEDDAHAIHVVKGSGNKGGGSRLVVKVADGPHVLSELQRKVPLQSLQAGAVHNHFLPSSNGCIDEMIPLRHVHDTGRSVAKRKRNVEFKIHAPSMA